MRARFVTLASAAILAVVAGPVLAQSVPPVVGVHQGPDGSVCVGVSYQVQQCTPPAAVRR
jgi:hypothetical protein